ncbi:Uncharacterised protein [Vibrio cholerae]|uniref:Uncharacterized protein n=1 Tax=Vibrio cholerae TaxID=666 RepID=A0A655ZIC7_VIBCL|nr:Uncharacterised protein [Vibrio cholerae]CSA70875.1 Uncharacterised protein [Vibrio cholerae]CSC31380.1 Uncharacterised protein [Vibrio cholerae]CSC69238.1 Uncharacterised protein [Vibrio cholerae]
MVDRDARWCRTDRLEPTVQAPQQNEEERDRVHPHEDRSNARQQQRERHKAANVGVVR